jgi:hypothetical protein
MHIKIKFLPQNEIFLGVQFGIQKVVRDLKSYDPESDDYDKAYVLDIGFLLGSIQFTFV